MIQDDIENERELLEKQREEVAMLKERLEAQVVCVCVCVCVGACVYMYVCLCVCADVAYVYTEIQALVSVFQ